jgi:transcriptional regulator GlxA family with amidase domain
MADVKIRVEVPTGLEEEFKEALEQVVGEFIGELRFSVARRILSRSKLTEQQARELAERVKEGIAERHGVP